MGREETEDAKPRVPEGTERGRERARKSHLKAKWTGKAKLS
jgi:hypothetical protein